MLKSKSVEAISNYISSVRGELHKVTWPKRDEVVRLTLMVVIVSAIVGGYLGGLDLGFTKLLEYVLAN